MMAGTAQSHEFELPDVTATESLGRALALGNDGPAIILLEGELGAGKTTVARGFLRAVGHQGAVKSPTFTLVESYELAQRSVHHFDLYRIADPSELDFIGFEEYFNDGSDVLIEWPSLGGDRVPQPSAVVRLAVSGLQRRVSVELGAGYAWETFRKHLNS